MQRLRLVSLTVILMLLIASIAITVSLARLDTLQREMASRHVPMLAMSSKLQTNFAEVHQLAEQVARTDSAVELARLDARVEEAFQRVDSAIGQMRRLDADSPSLQELSEAFADVERGLDDVLELAARKAIRKQYLDSDIHALKAAYHRLQALAEPAHTRTVNTLHRTLKRASDENPLDATALDELDRLMLAQSSLTVLMLSSETLIELADGLLAASTMPDDLARLAERVRLELRGMPTILLRLDDGELRQRLAAPIADLRERLLGEDGLLVSMERLGLDGTLLSDSRERSTGAIYDASSLVDEHVANIENVAALTAIELNRSTELTLTVVILTVALVLGVLVSSGYVILERQINRRIGVLADEVLRIASGDDGKPVAVDGNDEIGDIARALRVFRDNAHELRRSNEELEKFAYAAAHDMRSPLRAIESLATWTLEDAGDILPDECRENMEKLLIRAQRLSKLQDDLLDYARVGKIDDSLGDADVRALATEIHAMIDPEKRFELRVTGDIAPHRTHVVPLRQILLNLFTNAIKHHDRRTGTIVLSVRADDTRLQLAVSDDGPGIESRFHENIFGLFKTLRSRDDVEGSGLGLSLIRKLVERYGGSVRVHSEPERERGTTFIFDLPRHTPADTYLQAA